MVVLALLSDPNVVRRILLHLELPADLPTPAPAVLADQNLFAASLAHARAFRLRLGGLL
jgi:hypothetical protein